MFTGRNYRPLWHIVLRNYICDNICRNRIGVYSAFARGFASFCGWSFSATGSFNIAILLLLLWAAAFLGDTANYLVGHYFGRKIIDNPKIPINQAHIDKTQKFYDKYGGKTIFLARFCRLSEHLPLSLPAREKWTTKIYLLQRHRRICLGVWIYPLGILFRQHPRHKRKFFICDYCHHNTFRRSDIG